MTKSPNCIVVLTDQQRWDSLGSNGNPQGLTPTLDQMSETGISSDTCFSAQPVCAPSRASIQTGRYATNTGVYRNELALAPEVPTLAHHFSRAGFNTAYVGKWHLAGTDSLPVPPNLRGGYSRWLAADVVETVSDVYDAWLFDESGARVALAGYRSDAYFHAALNLIRELATSDRPFFLFLSLIEPHHRNATDDYPAPREYAESYQPPWIPADLGALGGNAAESLPGYWGMVRRIDEGMEQLIATLKAERIHDRTVVAYTSDHGCHFKTRNGEYKRSAHDSSIRVPFVLNGPDIQPSRLDRLISLVDLAPTLLDIAGIDIPQAMEGHSIGQLVGGSSNASWPREVFVQISESQVGRAIRTSRWKYAVTGLDVDGWDDAYADRYSESLLYDLRSDPHELENLVDSPAHADVRTELRERLLLCMANIGEPSATVVT